MRRKRSLRGNLIRFFLFFLGIIALGIVCYRYFTTGSAYISPLPKDKAAFVPGVNQQLVEEILRQKGVDYERIFSASDSSYLIRLRSGTDVLVTGDKDMVDQVSSLQLILARLTIEGKGVSRLDLRYNKPVVVFK